jgi:hypothetical protein
VGVESPNFGINIEGEKTEKEFKEINKIPIDEGYSCSILEGPEYSEENIPAGSVGEHHDLVLELKDEKGEKVKILNEFLPPDSKMIVRYLQHTRGRMNTFPEKGLIDVEIKSGDVPVKEPADILGVLHEMGHLQQAQDLECKYLEEQQSLEKIPQSEITKEQEQKLFEATANSERDAWARALKMVRKIKQENGVDMTKYYGWKELEKWIDHDLDTYEKKVFEKTEGEIKNLFLKNKKYIEGNSE